MATIASLQTSGPGTEHASLGKFTDGNDWPGFMKDEHERTSPKNFPTSPPPPSIEDINMEFASLGLEEGEAKPTTTSTQAENGSGSIENNASSPFFFGAAVAGGELFADENVGQTITTMQVSLPSPAIAALEQPIPFRASSASQPDDERKPAAAAVKSKEPCSDSVQEETAEDDTDLAVPWLDGVGDELVDSKFATLPQSRLETADKDVDSGILDVVENDIEPAVPDVQSTVEEAEIAGEAAATAPVEESPAAHGGLGPDGAIEAKHSEETESPALASSSSNEQPEEGTDSPTQEKDSAQQENGTHHSLQDSVEPVGRAETPTNEPQPLEPPVDGSERTSTSEAESEPVSHQQPEVVTTTELSGVPDEKGGRPEDVAAEIEVEERGLASPPNIEGRTIIDADNAQAFGIRSRASRNNRRNNSNASSAPTIARINPFEHPLPRAASTPNRTPLTNPFEDDPNDSPALSRDALAALEVMEEEDWMNQPIGIGSDHNGSGSDSVPPIPPPPTPRGADDGNPRSDSSGSSASGSSGAFAAAAVPPPPASPPAPESPASERRVGGGCSVEETVIPPESESAVRLDDMAPTVEGVPFTFSGNNGEDLPPLATAIPPRESDVAGIATVGAAAAGSASAAAGPSSVASAAGASNGFRAGERRPPLSGVSRPPLARASSADSPLVAEMDRMRRQRQFQSQRGSVSSVNGESWSGRNRSCSGASNNSADLSSGSVDEGNGRETSSIFRSPVPRGSSCGGLDGSGGRTRRTYSDGGSGGRRGRGPSLSSVKEQISNFRGEGGMMERLFGDNNKPSAARRRSRNLTFDIDSAAGSILPRTLLPSSVFYNTHTEKWVATINTNQKALDSGNTRAASKALKAFSFETKQEAEEMANANAPPRMLPFSNSPTCFICESKFAVFRRACHCRNCGVCICSKCTTSWPSKMIPDTYNTKKEKSVNICKSCDWLANAFRQALLGGRHDEAVALHATGNVNLRTPFSNIKGEVFYPIHCAALGGSIGILRWLVDSHLCPLRIKRARSGMGPIDYPLETSNKRTVLSIAMEFQQVDILRYLVVDKDMSVLETKDLKRALLSLDAVLRKLPSEPSDRSTSPPSSPVSSNSAAIDNAASAATEAFRNTSDGADVENNIEYMSNFIEQVSAGPSTHGSPTNADNVAMLSHLSQYESMEHAPTASASNIQGVISTDESENKDDASVASSSTDECIICYENTIDCVITPCGHQICCLQCSTHLSHCPVCNVNCWFIRVFRR